MDGRDDKGVVDWGQGVPLPPSVKRADPLGWLRASACAGAFVGFAALALVWRELPVLGEVPWGIADQLGCSTLTGIRFALSHFFEAKARSCAAAWSRVPDSVGFGVYLRMSFAGLAACAPAALFYRGLMAPRDSLIHMRGAVRREGADAVRSLRAKFERDFKKRPDHDIAPGVPYPAGMWSKHVLLVGGTGAGKSTFIKPLLQTIVDKREPLLMFDPKGEFTARFGGPVILAPWDKRSHAWDIGRDVRNIADMRRFAESVVDPSTDPMWANASRQILVGLMSYLQNTRGSDWGFQQLADLVASPQASLSLIMAKHHPEAARLVEKASVTTQGILINLTSACAPLFDLAMAWGDVPQERRVSFVDWALGKGRHKQIILQGHASYPALTKSYARPIVEVVASLVASAEMTDDPLRKRWFVCDEFPALGKVNIRLLIEQGRSRGFRCVLACQDFAQLEEIHGDKMVKAMTAMVGTVVIGRIGPGDTADQLAKAVGTREVERPNLSSSYAGVGGSTNRSTTLSFARDQIPIYLPSELASRLGEDQARGGVVMALVADGGAYELFWPFVDVREVRPQSVLADWTFGRGGASSEGGSESCSDGGSGDGSAPGGRAIGQDAPGHQERHADSPGGAGLAERPYAALGAVEIEVVSDAGPVAHAGESPEGVVAAAWDGVLGVLGRVDGMGAASSLMHAAHVAEATLDARPGPREEARLVQKPPIPSEAGAKPER
jgi:Type IV secretion-system coupling protein DNA-binding domain